MVTTGFRYELAETIFNSRLRRPGAETWYELAYLVADEVCGGLLSKEEVDEVGRMISDMEFIPGGRYLAFAGKEAKYFQNCYAFISREDTRENWSELLHKASSALMTGGGIGNDYSVYRPYGVTLGRSGGNSSGPIPLMESVNAIGRSSMQGGGRRSAIYASLKREHDDVHQFLSLKNWHEVYIPGTNTTYAEAKQVDFDFDCPMDHTNISVNYGDEWLHMEDRHLDEVFVKNCKQALQTAEPGFSFNFGDQASFTGRNACTEFVTDQDGDACNLGSVNMSRINSLSRFREVCRLASKFLYCGTIRAMTPTQEIKKIRDANRRVGLGLMGVHEWLVRRGHRYEVVPEMHEWLEAYRMESEVGANEIADVLGLPRPKAYRAIAPTGTIGIYAGTTTGIEPIFATAFKRRYRQGPLHKYQFVVDPTAKVIAQESGVDPDSIESSFDLASDFERRIKFQADIQDYVDMAISSTINLPAWGTEHNNEDTVLKFAECVSKYAPRLRGLTCYPDGSRGGQPLQPVPYAEAVKHEGKNFTEEVVDVCDLSGHGTCNA
jgi:ribonucleoside-diphosphate reductase alpha chain